MVLLGRWLDLMILEVISTYDSVILWFSLWSDLRTSSSTQSGWQVSPQPMGLRLLWEGWDRGSYLTGLFGFPSSHCVCVLLHIDEDEHLITYSEQYSLLVLVWENKLLLFLFFSLK